MIELEAWPLDNKQYTSVALGASYAARSRGLLTAESFSLTTNGDNTVTLTKGLGCLHVSEFWACFPYSKNDITVQFEDADGVYPRKDVLVLGYDKNANEAGIYVRTGIAAESPAMPELRQDSDYDETFLYCVNRPTGATSITPDNVVDLRLNQDYCGLMRDTIDAIDTTVMQAAFEAFLNKIQGQIDLLQKLLAEVEGNTAWMLKSLYDGKNRNKDIFDTISANAPMYTALYTLDGWTEADEDAKGKGYAYQQTVTLTPDDPDAPTVTADSKFLPQMGTPKTGVAEADEILKEALNIIADGVSTAGAGTVTTLVREKPTSDIPVVWTLRTEV